VETLSRQSKAVFDEAEYCIEALHTINHFEDGILAACVSLIGKQKQREGVVLQNAVDQLLLLGYRPD
jgi:hypothetical protein